MTSEKQSGLSFVIRHSSFVIRHLEKDADARFVHQAISGLRDSEAETEVRDHILAQLEIAARIKLVDLLACGERGENGSCAPVILHGDVDLPAHFIGHAYRRFKTPTFFGAGASKRARYDCIQIALKAPD